MKLFPRIAHAVAACLTILLLLAPAALAAGDEERTPLELGSSASAREAASGGGGGGIARMIVGLAIVIAVIYGLSWVLRQVKAAREGQATGTGLSPLSSLPLGPNRSLHLVRVGDEVVLLGAAEKGITTIRTYGLDEAASAGLIADPDAPAAGEPPLDPTARPARPPRPGGGTAFGTALLEVLRQRTVRR
jgi:flagellar protein FliO/FliZ